MPSEEKRGDGSQFEGQDHIIAAFGIEESQRIDRKGGECYFEISEVEQGAVGSAGGIRYKISYDGQFMEVLKSYLPQSMTASRAHSGLSSSIVKYKYARESHPNPVFHMPVQVGKERTIFDKIERNPMIAGFRVPGLLKMTERYTSKTGYHSLDPYFNMYKAVSGIDEFTDGVCDGIGFISGPLNMTLRDLVIYHKRNFTRLLISQINIKKEAGTLFRVRQRIDIPKISEKWEDSTWAPYPLAMFEPTELSKSMVLKKNITQLAYNRMYMVHLVANINIELFPYVPHEVIIRNGFGGMVPAVSDIADHGFRLDPGLFPATEQIMTMIISAMLKTNKALTAMSVKDFQANCNKLNGFDEGVFQYMGLLMKKLLDKHPKRDMKTPDLKIYNTHVFVPESVVRFRMGEILRLSQKLRTRRKIGQSKFQLIQDSAVDMPGSDSDEDVGVVGGKRQITMRKLSFTSGMCAITSSLWAADKFTEGFTLREQYLPHAAYFEVYSKGSDYKFHTPHLNAAPLCSNFMPSPLMSGPLEFIKTTRDRPILSIDATNCTSYEIAAYMHEMKIRHLQDPKLAPYPQMLIIQTSNSKHPHGGDLLYGQIILFGHDEYVNRYTDFLQANTFQQVGVFMNLDEHSFRLKLQNANVMHKNRQLADLVRQLGDQCGDKSAKLEY